MSEIIEDKELAVEKTAAELPVENVSLEEAVTDPAGEQKVIKAQPRKRGPRKSNVQPKENGVVGSMAADIALGVTTIVQEPEVVKESPADGKVALWSDRNLRWNLVGSLSKGYNIVTKEAAEKFLTLRGVRQATPEEVKTYYGK